MLWNIRKRISKGDYDYALVPEHPKATKNGYVLMHRVVMENLLGRLLSEDEEVHHKDKNGKNNLVSNLEVMSKEDHRELHLKEQRGRTLTDFVCPECGTTFSKERRLVHKPRINGPFCSRSCSGKFNRRQQLS